MAYISLYRKWRPQSFSDVVGQAHVVRTLENSLNNNRVGHAYLFTGPRGTGKTTVARLLAKSLNCESGPSATPCEQCDQCRDITRGSSLNVIEIDGASNRGIEEIRDLREKARYAPSQGRYKVYIIDEVHMLTTEAFNALLKTLEEPPPHVVFIFATTDPQKIPPTILSRCLRFDFQRFSTLQISERLADIAKREGVTADQEALMIIAEHADGGMRDALGILDQCLAYASQISAKTVTEVLGTAERETLEAFLRYIRKRETLEALQIISQLHNQGRDLRMFLRDLIQYLRKTALISDAAEERLWGLRIMELAGRCEQDMRYASDPKISLELLVLRLVDLPNEVEKLSERIAALEEQLEQAVRGQGVGTKPEPSTTEDSVKQTTVRVSANDREALSQIQDRWLEYLQALREERLVHAEAFLREGTPVRLGEGVLTVAFPKERGFHKASIEQDKHREPAERTLSRFFGRQLRIVCVTDDSASARASAPETNHPDPTANRPPSKPDKRPEDKMKSQKDADTDAKGELDESVAAALRMFGGKIVKIDK